MSEELDYLSAEQKGSLDGLPFSVLLPSSLPLGWNVSHFEFEEFDEGASFALAVQKGEGTLSFLTTNEGIGDPPGGARKSVHNHPEFGDLAIEHEEDGDFLSDWMEVKNGWSAVGGRSVSDADLDLVVAELAIF